MGLAGPAEADRDLIKLGLHQGFGVRHADLAADLGDPAKPSLRIERGMRDDLVEGEDHAALCPDQSQRGIVGRWAKRGQALLALGVVLGEGAAHLGQERQGIGRGRELLVGQGPRVEALGHADDLLAPVRRVVAGLCLPALIDARDVAARLALRDAIILGKGAFYAPWADAGAEHLFDLVEAFLEGQTGRFGLLGHASPCQASCGWSPAEARRSRMTAQ